MRKNLRTFPLLILAVGSPALCQTPAPPNAPPSQTITITLPDAVARAEKYGTQIQAADIVARLAHEDKVQARAATLPSLSMMNQFIYTEGNGTPSGVFVANDGVHVYNEQAVVHEELLSFLRRGEIRVATAAEAVARAKVDVATRGLKVTVVQDYFGIAAAQRQAANTNRALNDARQFLDITQKQEQGGEAAHSDVIKAQLQVEQRQRDLQDAGLAILKAKVALSVLIFPTLQLNYSIVDDASQLGALPPMPEAAAQASATSPDLRAANKSVVQARQSVGVAKYGYLPSLGLDLFYGINANQFAARTGYPTQATGRGTLPNYLVPFRQNLGYSAQATLTIPVWNWGSVHSKVKQASQRERQAELDLMNTRRQLNANVTSAYQEAEVARSQVASLRTSTGLADDSLRLTLLRYKAGEATALEVVDAQATANLARNAYDNGLVRYRIALLTLQTLTGNF
ncbi:MAG TPA: TolC family protein [Bryobacteraceae bacterium]|nr:TolC family protein [Bryobacteraceae bacterium]